ncbi:SUN domain-containing protein 3-like [Hyposmocoma kahamanoa]|uniref:SUN domain-containing protein 3-like n=1 Tax=Hyposmocoma kahamanoa TaxID=1477025 RepID=UPI000E6D7BA0|nr:SUN domain-containing protein 3-like [Hyposmocoma kahamanoa]
MVMLTRSSYRRACESCDVSDLSKPQKNIVAPPWCSMAKVYEKKKSRKVATPTWETRSSYPLRENIWEYLYEDKTKFYKRKNGRVCCKQTPAKNKRRGKIVICLPLLFSAVGVIMYLWIFNKIPETSLMAKTIPRNTLISLLDLEQTAVDEECCSRIKHLAEALLRAEQALRSALRLRRTIMITSETAKTVSQNTDRSYIHGVSATKGLDTEEFGGRVALWGVVPLWRVAPPPDVILALRKPMPADCWPFSGSHGEVVFHLPHILRIQAFSVEHVRPDTALSAPKHFILYGILPNETWVTAVQNEYKHHGAAKQYYYSLYKQVPLKKLIFRVLSNQGNAKYTCIYRVHFYENEFDQF